MPSVDTTCDFLEWYESLCDSNVKAGDGPYEAYYKQLEDRRNECVSLTDQVSNKTNLPWCPKKMFMIEFETII